MARLYDRRSWRRLSRAYLATHPMCEQCDREGRLRAANQVDHKVALKDGGDPWSWDNLQAYCDTCHAEKTLIVEQGKHLSGALADGSPRDPHHPWHRS